jgi:hypothetical protein
MTPTNIPYPQFLTKPWRCNGTPRSAGGVLPHQAGCPLSRGILVATSLDKRDNVFYRHRPCTVGDIEEEYKMLEGDGAAPPSSSLSVSDRQLGKDTRGQMNMNPKCEHQC